jgi:hypothetical protein
LNQLVEVSVWSACARMLGFAVACAITYTSPFATVPVSAIVRVDVPPLNEKKML